LVNWGFSYADLVNMPLKHLENFIDLLIKQRKMENEAKNGNSDSTSEKENIAIYSEVFRG